MIGLTTTSPRGDTSKSWVSEAYGLSGQVDVQEGIVQVVVDDHCLGVVREVLWLETGKSGGLVSVGNYS